MARVDQNGGARQSGRDDRKDRPSGGNPDLGRDGGRSTGGPAGLDALDAGGDPGRPGIDADGLLGVDNAEGAGLDYADEILSGRAGDEAVDAGPETGGLGGDDTATSVGGGEMGTGDGQPGWPRTGEKSADIADTPGRRSQGSPAPAATSTSQSKER